MKILITGGAGYIGTELVKVLVADPKVKEVIVYDNLQKGNYTFFIGNNYLGKEKIKFIEGDILDTRKFKKSLSGVEVLYHLAAKVTTPFANVDAHYFEQVNHWGTAEVSYCVEESDVQKYIFTSSVSVYGSSSKMATETTEANPRTHYGISKMRGEDHVRRLQEKKNAIVLRCGNVYGYSKAMRFDAVINRFLFDANFNGRISIHGNGKQHRGFIPVDMLTNILHQLLWTDVPSATYNLVGKNIQILDLIDELKELFDGLEYLFVNQHMSLRELQVSPESEIYKYIKKPPMRSLKEELEVFKNQFAF
jgi:UDP-glucose 4-epimerase